MEANGFQDSMEEAEVAALQMMVDVSLGGIHDQYHPHTISTTHTQSVPPTHNQYRPHTIGTAHTTRYKLYFLSLADCMEEITRSNEESTKQTLTMLLFICIIFVVDVVV